MVAWSVEEMFEKNFLKRILPSKERAAKSIETAEKYLAEAGKDFDIGSDMHVCYSDRL